MGHSRYSTVKHPTIGGHSFNRRTWLATAALATAATAGRLHERASAWAYAPDPGLTDVQRQALRAVMEGAIDRGVIPGGSLLLLSHGRVVYREAFGLADLESRRPFTTEAPCFIASLTKPITATFFVMLDERGVISLDDPVEKFLPEFRGIRVKGRSPPATPPRVWQLLAHRSDLPGNADLGDARPNRAQRSPDEVGVLGASDSLAGVVARWAGEGLLAEPGTRFAYGSPGYMAAARIAEVVLGGRYERLLREWLLAPLHMTRTTFRPDAEVMRQVPVRYLRTEAGLERETRAHPLPGPDGLVNPAGGLYSTLDDLASFLALHLDGGLADGKRLVSPQSLARMYRPHPPRAANLANAGETDGGYGLGWNIMTAAGSVRHLGGSGTMAWLDLPRQNAGVLLTQVPWNGNHQLIPRL